MSGLRRLARSPLVLRGLPDRGIGGAGLCFLAWALCRLVRGSRFGDGPDLLGGGGLFRGGLLGLLLCRSPTERDVLDLDQGVHLAMSLPPGVAGLGSVLEHLDLVALLLADQLPLDHRPAQLLADM